MSGSEHCSALVCPCTEKFQSKVGVVSSCWPVVISTLPDLPTPNTTNSLCPYFQIFYRIFLWMHHQSVKTKQCQRSIFLSFIFLRTVCELTFSIIHTYYTQTTLFCLHLRKCHSRLRTTEHFLQKQCTG